MKLEEIGFYTLADSRAKNASATSPLFRCEMILTSACNFKCLYCRGLKPELRGSMSFEKVKSIIDYWASHGLKNIRFSGGEPTIYNNIVASVAYAKYKGIKRIAISTNGSTKLDFYKSLIRAGVNDFSVSLDSCCASTGDKMAGGVNGSWITVTNNIAELSKLVYTTVGIVINEENIDECIRTITLADKLGVADIRIIPSAQFNKLLEVASNIDNKILDKHPILKYRVNNIRNKRHVRGIHPTDTYKCPLVLDDMAVAGDYHFSCIIYMREQGNPIGKISDRMRVERAEWYRSHNTHEDPICKNNCLDVCIDYNNKVEENWK